jgi:4-hydroxy-3-methylbut-2-enyl diphosphate reductase
MQVTLAKTAGFCPGVKRAVETAYREAGECGRNHIPVYTFGPIIHNEEVVKDLAVKGVGIIYDISELEQLPPSHIVIRSHGVGKAVYDKIAVCGHTLIDATCPFVTHIHKIVRESSEKGHVILIVGDRKHPEVEGITGWCKEQPYVLQSLDEVEKLPDFGDKNITCVSQTTFNLKKFQDIVELLKKKYYNVIVCKTICNATEERQQEAKQLAADVEAMIVIGGLSSSNTQKLYEISKQECENTYYIQTLVDLDLTAFESVSRVGITAGASTPNYIIKEVHDSMSELSFEQMLQEENPVSIRPGQVVEGKVIDVKPDEIVVDIQYKSDGIITRNEYSNTPNLDLTTVVKVGDPITVKVIKTNDGEGQVALSYKRVAAEKAYTELEEAFNNETVLTGKVTQALQGGLSVSVGECRVFIPASLVSDTYEKNLEKYLDQDIEFVLTEFNPRKRRVIGNRKKLIVEKKAEAAKELFARIEVGQTVEGSVKNVTDFGAFIDLGGADGLLHISEMSWGRVDSPKKLFKVGDHVRAFIKDINGEKIALSLKFDEENPWLTADEKYAIGNVVTGKVARMTDFGAFVELEPGVDALLHVSQISNEHVEKPSDVYKVGDEVTAKVVDFKAEDRKISLSVKALLKDTEAEEAADSEEE